VEILAQLPDLAYEDPRKAKAEELGIRVAALDEAVKRARRRKADGAEGETSLNPPPRLEPWPEPVDGTELLSGLVTEIARHIAAPEEDALAVALWARLLMTSTGTVASCQSRAVTV
jgi:hypothetical protein